MQVVVDSASVRLGREHFVASGGEGTVYARDGVAYKIFSDPTTAPDARRIRELAAVQDPHVIRPETPVFDQDGRIVGHTMRFLADHIPYCRLFTRSFRDAANVGPEIVLRLARNLRKTLAAIHVAGITVVDLNPMNLLVSPDLREVFLIDVASWATPSFPATAVLDSVNDRHATHHGPESDWFAFAVVTFQAFVGVHPYRGTHPRVKGLDARMQANVSVFDPAVKIPPICYRFDDIPPAWRDWYRRVFEDGERTAPPSWTAAVPVDAIPVPGRAIGISPRANRKVLAEVVDGMLVLTDVQRKARIPLVTSAREVTSFGGQIAVRTNDKLLHIVLHDVGSSVIASPRVVADVLPNATRLFSGVAIQDLLGATWALLLHRSGACHRLRLDALDDCRVVDATLAEDNIVVTTFRDGRLQREVYRAS